MSIHVSKGNSKLGKIANVSLMPIVTCNRCAGCTKGDCYALKALIYPEAKKAWQDNTREAKKNPKAFADYVGKWIDSRKKPVKFFRLHVAGDFFSQAYFEAIKDMVGKHPQTTFLAFTKQYGIDFGAMPENFSLVISAWPNLAIPEELQKRFPIAWMNDTKNPDNRIPQDALPCPGNCNDCGLCWSLKRVGKDVVFDKH